MNWFVVIDTGGLLGGEPSELGDCGMVVSDRSVAGERRLIAEISDQTQTKPKAEKLVLQLEKGFSYSILSLETPRIGVVGNPGSHTRSLVERPISACVPVDHVLIPLQRVIVEGRLRDRARWTVYQAVPCSRRAT